MSGLIKIVSSQRRAYLGAEFLDSVRTSNDREGVELRLHGGTATKASKAADGEVLESSKVKAGQKVVIEFGTIRPSKFHVDIIPNCRLFDLLTPAHSMIRVPSQTIHSVSLLFTANVSFDLEELDTHLISVYLVE